MSYYNNNTERNGFDDVNRSSYDHRSRRRDHSRPYRRSRDRYHDKGDDKYGHHGSDDRRDRRYRPEHSRHESKVRYRSPVSPDGEYSPSRKKNKSFWDVTPEEMVKMGYPLPMDIEKMRLEQENMLFQQKQMKFDGAPFNPMYGNQYGRNFPNPNMNNSQYPNNQYHNNNNNYYHNRNNYSNNRYGSYGGGVQTRRVYIGNIPDEASEDDMIRFFNETMNKTGKASSKDPVTNCIMKKEKKFVFLDFKTDQDATQAMSLDGIRMNNLILKIRRPSNYVAPKSESQKESDVSAVPGLVSTNVENNPNKLFIGGLPAQLTEEQVLDILSQNGKLKSFNLVKDINTGISKGFAFCEYTTTETTDKVISELNGLEMGGKRLVVQRASVGAKQNQQNTGKFEINTPEDAAVYNLLNINTRIDNTLNTLMSQKLANMEQTSVLVLLNLVSSKDVKDDEDYESFKQDIETEMSKYGTIEDIEIPRPNEEVFEEQKREQNNYLNLYKEGVGKVFIKYKTVEEAQTAQQAVAGRKFSGNIVITSFFEEESFESRNFY